MQNGPRYDCALDAAMSVIEGRWKTTILCLLTKNGSLRFSELQRMMPGITPRILSKQLKGLESDGMVLRTADGDAGTKVYYSITEAGESICPILAQLAQWGIDHRMVDVIVPRDPAGADGETVLRARRTADRAGVDQDGIQSGDHRAREVGGAGRNRLGIQLLQLEG